MILINRKKLYTVEVFYGGHFVHVPYFSYTSNLKKIYEDVDFENLTVTELKACFSDVVGEYDSLYVKGPEHKIYLLSPESKEILVENCDSKIVLHVYHVSPLESESDIERDEADGYGCSDDEYV